MSEYTDEDVKRAFDALGCRPRTIERMCDSGPVQECVRHAELWPCGVGLRSVEAVLDAVAPAIAARALREFADNHVGVQTPARMAEDLHERADEIAKGRI